MKLSANQQAPLFNTTDVYGKQINLQKLNGNTIYLSFERNAGCPICNLRTHELFKQSEFFSAKNIIVLMVYESSAEKMREYLGDTVYPFHFIADPENKFYNLYGVERSFLKVMKGLFHGLVGKAMSGNKLFRKPMKQDGHLSRIPAEFIIRRHGELALAHYGEFVGDHVPVETLKGLLVI